MVVVVRLLMVLVPSEFSAKVLFFLFVQIVEPHKSTAMLVMLVSTVVKSLCVLAVVKRGKPITKETLSFHNSSNSSKSKEQIK